MVILSQDLLKVKKGIICHQCNCKGVMGAGLAKKMREQWPQVYVHYKRAFEPGKLALGMVQLITVDSIAPIIVANIMGQDDYGREKKQYTDLPSVRLALEKIKAFRDAFTKAPDLQIYIPFKMGCNLGGANWSDMMRLITIVVPNALICREPPKLGEGI